MSLLLPKTCAMGGSKTGLVGTIGLTLLNPDGTVHTARATANIYELGGGCYGKNVTFPDDWKGSLKWDTGGGSPVYAVEDYIEGLIDEIEDTLTDIKGTGFVKDTHSLVDIQPDVARILKATEIKQCTVNDAGASTTKFITSLTETDSNFWNRGAIRFTSGDNDGQIRAIKNYAGASKEITIQTPLNSAPANGDTFIILTERKFLTPDIGDVLEGITDIKGTGFVKDTDSLVDIRPETDKIQTGIINAKADYKADVSNLDVLVSSRNDITPPAVNEIRLEMEGAGTKLTTIKDKTDTIDWIDIIFLKDIEGGRWKIESNQMVFYKADNVTPIATFNLLKTGVPTETEPDERIRV